MADNVVGGIQYEFTKLAHKQATVTYGVLGVLVIFMGMVGTGGYFALKAFNAQADKAAAQYIVYTDTLKDFQTQLALHDTQRQAAEVKVADLQAQIAKRAAQPLPKPVVDGLQEHAPAQAVAGALLSLFPNFDPPEVTTAGKIALSPPEAQQVISRVVDGDRAKLNFQDEKQTVDLQNGTISSLNNDLGACRTTLAEADKTISGYKKVVAPTRWKRFLQGAEKVGLFIAGAALGKVL